MIPESYIIFQVLCSSQEGAVAITAHKKDKKTVTGGSQKPSFVVKYSYDSKYFTASLYNNRECISTGNSHGHWRNDPGGRFGETTQLRT